METKFNKFENNEIKPLADDILVLQKDENGEYVKIEEPVEIEQVIDIIKDKEEIKKLKSENRQLRKELYRKEKALAETAALLTLKKKAAAIWGEEEE